MWSIWRLFLLRVIPQYIQRLPCRALTRLLVSGEKRVLVVLATARSPARIRSVYRWYQSTTPRALVAITPPAVFTTENARFCGLLSVVAGSSTILRLPVRNHSQRLQIGRCRFQWVPILKPRPGWGHGAGDGNRTHVASLEGWGFTTKLRPLNEIIIPQLSAAILRRSGSRALPGGAIRRNRWLPVESAQNR